MAIDVSELLLDDTDEAPSDSVSGNSTQPKRGRGRPKGTKRTLKANAAGVAAPGARELAKLLAKVVGGASAFVEMFIDLPGIALTIQEANDISRPAARILARTGIGQWIIRYFFGAQALGGDYGKLVGALVLYGVRIYPLIVQRQEQIAAQQQAQKGRPFGQPSTEDTWVRSASAQAPAASNGHAGNAADDAARAAAAADAARWGGLGFTDPDALAAGFRGDIAALVRATPPN